MVGVCVFLEVRTCQSSSFGKSPVLYQNSSRGESSSATEPLLNVNKRFLIAFNATSAGFRPDRDPCLLYDDACVVPERLEGEASTACFGGWDSGTEHRDSFCGVLCQQGRRSRTVCRTSAAAPCSSGSSCSPFWTTLPTGT